ncbi:MAG: S24/S26 family peptidase [Alistipes sp.]|nr:S24/S26 family peptidase [Alistipes sp.]
MLTEVAKDNIESLVDPGESFKIVVTGYSMLPLLGYGRDTIVVRRTYSDEPIGGRIAMFRAKDRHIIVHRVIAVDGDNVTFQGDGNPYQREHCKRGDVVGVVDEVIREDGRTVSCITRRWRLRECVWLCQHTLVRRYALAILRRLANCKRKNRG